MIETHCPACAKQHVAQDGEAGGTWTCSCGNVNVVPDTPAAQAPEAPEFLYQGRPSQLENLWMFVGLAPVIIVCLWPVRQLLGTIFKTSSWDWYIALILILAFFAWLSLRLVRLRCTHYTVTAENMLIEHGILFKTVDNIDLFRVTDVNMTQSILQRVLGVGTIVILSSDKSLPEARLRNIPEPRAVFEKVRKASVDADTKRGVMQIEH